MNAEFEHLADLPVIPFPTATRWEEWLEVNHASARGVWAKLSKKGSGIASVSYVEAVAVALCFGWIDGQKKPYDADWWLQKFTARRPRSLWSRINREKAEALELAGRIRPAGAAAIAAAKADGRWNAAYDSSTSATVPEDLQAALDASPVAKTRFQALNRTNQYAILVRLQTAKRPETRQRRLAGFIAMLERGETLYP